jgi:hypothetical protein
MFAMVASLPTWHGSGEMIHGTSLDLPLNSSDDDPSRDSFLLAAATSPPQRLRSAALYLNERYEIRWISGLFSYSVLSHHRTLIGI